MAVRPQYIFKINEAYVKDANDDTEITRDSDEGLEWKDAYKEFKSKIRIHLKLQQNGRCAFCRCRISVGTSYSNLEHIVSKDDYEQFETLPENIVYCCWLCNRSKGKKTTIAHPVQNKTLQAFPTTSDGFVIINPYHDDYQNHIDFLDEIIIIKSGDSIKGQNTIEYYNLTRPELAEDRVREFNLDPADVMLNVILRLTESVISLDVLAQIDTIIENMPTWTI